MTALFSTIRATFEKNQESVTQLLNFDKIILDFCIQHLEDLERALKENSETKISNLNLLPQKTIKALQDIKENDSFRHEYKEMFNQGLVLAVSHFSSAIHSIFREAINQVCCCYPNLLKATNEDIKITFEELKDCNFNLKKGLGDLIIKKKNISFQDMKSISKAFKDFFNLDIEKDADINNIILAQAARHSIVHANAIADEKFITQIKDTTSRNIKNSINPEEKIEFKTSEIQQIQKSMMNYIDNLINKLKILIQNEHDFLNEKN